MASVTCTPSPANVNQPVTVEALDFLPSTLATMTVMSPHGNQGSFSSDASTDSSGEVASTDIPNYANGTLTLAGNAVAAETVTLGAVTYTWRTSVTTTANEVLIGATASASLDNLKSAINLDGTSGVYGSATVVHPTVRAGTKTATTLFIVAKSGGTGGNSLASTETMTNGSFGGATLSGGAAATTTNPFRFAPSAPGVWTVTVSDGTTSISTNLQVFQTT